MKWKLVVMISVINSVFLISQPLTSEEIREIALKFYQNIADTSQKNVTFTYEYYYCDNKPLVTLIKYADNNWLLISNEKKAPIILAFSDEKNYQSSYPPPFVYLLETYCREIELIRNKKIIPVDSFNSLHFILKTSPFQNKNTGVGPLIKSKWGQSFSNDSLDSAAYNFFAPPSPDESCQHTLAGCPAVALGQILRYYSFPTCPQFNFVNMPDELVTTDENYLLKKNEISNFLRNIGDKMNNDNQYFGCNASGTILDTIYTVIKRDFLFYKAVLHKRENYDLQEWKNLIKSELSHLRPILYLGFNQNGGHAFICDGFKKNLWGTYFHFNFGWNGWFDGYYKINHPFPVNQSAIFLDPNECSSFLFINQIDKFISSNFYSPLAGTIFSSPTYVVIENGETVHYRAFHEIILENFESETSSNFIAEIVPCTNCNFTDYRQVYYNSTLLSESLSSNILNLDSKKSSEYKFNIFPNPFYEKIYIYPLSLPTRIVIFDISHKPIFEFELFFEHNELNLEFLKPGTYFLFLSNAYHSQTIKMIKL